MSATERRVVVIREGNSFRHETAIKVDTVAPQPLPVHPPHVAMCRTRRPEPQCECGMFALEWR